MKTSKKIISSVLAVIIVVSAMAIGGFSSSAASLKKPTGLKVTNANHSLVLKWNKVSGAKKYEIYRDSKLLSTTTKNSARDYAVTGGDTYAYKVRGIKGSTKGAFSATFKCTRINFTVITDIRNVKKGIQLKWVERTGVTKYIVERTVFGSSDWAEVGQVATLSFLDKTAVPGTKYTYRVTGYNASTKSYSTCSVGASVTCVLPVTGLTAKKAVNPKTRQITLKWTGSTGASSYNVYRQKITDEDFVKIANVTATSFVDTDIIDNPSAYRYYVTAMADDSESVETAQRFVFTYGSDPAYFDPQNDGGVRNYHVPLKFNVGDEYAEGKYLADYFSYNGSFDVTIREGADVVSVEDNVIKANKAGTAKVVITVTDSVRGIIQEVIQDDLLELLTSREVILEITVA